MVPRRGLSAVTPLLVVGVLGLIAVPVLWWLLVTTEGVYLGRRVVVGLYDLYAARYDKIKGFDPRNELLYLGLAVLGALRGVKAPLVLDVATGTGRLPLVLLNEPFFNGRVWGLDLARRMLVHAARKTRGHGDRVRWLWQRAEYLPFEDGSFDLVTCLEALEFFEDQRAVLAEIVRVLRPGGILLATRRLGRDAKLMPGKALREDALRGLLEALGFEAVEFKPWQMDYDYVWARKPGGSITGRGNTLPLPELLRCVRCSAAALVEEEKRLRCTACGAQYPIEGDIINLHGAANHGKGEIVNHE
ncbi:MAG: class I SAM-dependent methyltransferase [Anaerolineae bacterium]|nr:class I SAM-dependent methyltransferase [Anaerolineae bacterium]